MTDRPNQSRLLLPCFPFQKGQNGQSPLCGESSPSWRGQPILPSLIAAVLTPCWAQGGSGTHSGSALVGLQQQHIMAFGIVKHGPGNLTRTICGPDGDEATTPD